MTTTTHKVTRPDWAELKGRQRVAWASGDYAVIGGTLVSVAEALCEAVDLRAGQRVLDVATGSGNAAIAAARSWCEVTGIDYVPALIERARERAAVERLEATFQEGDAEDIPVADASFDVVLSTFGVMFAPHQEQAARELLRVCRPGGKVALANWTPDCFIGQVFRIIGQYLPPAVGMKSPMLWGSEARLRELFGDAIVTLEVRRRSYAFRYRSAEHWLEAFRTYYGPMLKTFGALEASQRSDLVRDLTDLAQRLNRSGDATMVVPSEYLEVVARKW